jgi:hypothetical protein
MHDEIDSKTDDVRETPIQEHGRTALLSGAFSLLPVFAALVWLTVGSAWWVVVVLAEIAVTALFFAVYIRFRLVFTQVTETAFMKRRMLLPFVRVDRDEISTLVLAKVYRHNSTETLTQLLGLASDGRRVLGMSGLFWTEASILRVAEALDVQTTVVEDNLLRRDYYALYPAARTWYGRRDVRALGVVASVAVVALAVSGIENLVSLP